MTQYSKTRSFLARILTKLFLISIFLLFASGCRERYFKAIPNKDFNASFYSGNSKLQEFEIHYIVHRPSERIRKTLRLYERKDLEFIENMFLSARPLINKLDNDSDHIFFETEGFCMGTISTKSGALYKLFTLAMSGDLIYLGVASKKGAYYFADATLKKQLKDFVKRFECGDSNVSFNRIHDIEKKGFVLYQKNVKEEQKN